MDRQEQVILAAIMLLIVGFFAAAFWAVDEDDKQWSAYSAQHHCRVAGTKAQSTGVGIAANGKLVTTINPSQTIYQCDGGEIEIR